jgi:hypothetical protein
MGPLAAVDGAHALPSVPAFKNTATPDTVKPYTTYPYLPMTQPADLVPLVLLAPHGAHA